MNSGTQVPDDMLATFRLGRCTPLDELYGADGQPAPAPEEDPHAEFSAPASV